MRISIVIPTCGRRDLLDRTLASLAVQVEVPPCEVVIVDDGADPGLTEHVAGLGLAVPAVVAHHPENRGRSATRNTGIARASGDVVLFLDGDMEVVPGFLAAHAAAHAAAGGDDSVVLGTIVTAAEVGRSAFVRYIDSRGVRKVPSGAEIPPRYFMTGNSSVAASLLARAGGFDEEFDEYGGEDTEMGYRLADHGARFHHAPDAVSRHLDLNSVPRMAERLRRYGETMLPVLVRKIPRARTELHLDWAEPVDSARDGARDRLVKLLARVVCRRSFWRPAAALGQVLPAWLPAGPLFDFVRAAAYLDGYRQSAGGRR